MNIGFKRFKKEIFITFMIERKKKGMITGTTNRQRRMVHIFADMEHYNKTVKETKRGKYIGGFISQMIFVVWHELSHLQKKYYKVGDFPSDDMVFEVFAELLDYLEEEDHE